MGFFIPVFISSFMSADSFILTYTSSYVLNLYFLMISSRVRLQVSDAIVMSWLQSWWWLYYSRLMLLAIFNNLIQILASISWTFGPACHSLNGFYFRNYYCNHIVDDIYGVIIRISGSFWIIFMHFINVRVFPFLHFWIPVSNSWFTSLTTSSRTVVPVSW